MFNFNFQWTLGGWGLRRLLLGWGLFRRESTAGAAKCEGGVAVDAQSTGLCCTTSLSVVKVSETSRQKCKEWMSTMSVIFIIMCCFNG